MQQPQSRHGAIEPRIETRKFRAKENVRAPMRLDADIERFLVIHITAGIERLGAQTYIALIVALRRNFQGVLARQRLSEERMGVTHHLIENGVWNAMAPHIEEPDFTAGMRDLACQTHHRMGIARGKATEVDDRNIAHLLDPDNRGQIRERAV